jgi:hypothetical protein
VGKAWPAGHAQYMVTVRTESVYMKSSVVTRLQTQDCTGICPILSLKTAISFVISLVSNQETVSSSHDFSAFNNDLTTFIYAVIIYFRVSSK